MVINRIQITQKQNILYVGMLSFLLTFSLHAYVFAEEVMPESLEAEAQTVQPNLENAQEALTETMPGVPSTDSVDEEVQETASEVMEEIPEPESAPAPGNYQPSILIGKLGQEFNLKVLYDHPMDREGGNYIEWIQMETLDEQFLGVKTFNERAQVAYAEFLVNPNLADFTEVMIIALSTKVGKIKTHVQLELTGEDTNLAFQEKRQELMPEVSEKKVRPEKRVDPPKQDKKKKGLWFF